MVMHNFVIPGEPRPYHSWKAPQARSLSSLMARTVKRYPERVN